MTDLEAYGERFAGARLPEVLASIDAGSPVTTSGRGFDAIQELGPEPTEHPLDRYDLRTNLECQRDNYAALCRGALVNLLWMKFDLAEEKVNIAKFIRDDWAFAHFIYGLLRGVNGDVGKAHFELYLAIHRETYLGARNRIERAIGLVRN